jgi:hypothetical protein
MSDKCNSGVYMIRDKRNGASYIGATRNLKKRLRTHLSQIVRGGTSLSYAKKEAFAGAIADDLEFRILEFVPVPSGGGTDGDIGLKCPDLVKREIYWIHRLNPSLNVRQRHIKSIDIDTLPVGPPDEFPKAVSA